MISSLLLFSVTEAFFSASPGPAVAMVVSAAMLGGLRVANAAIFGVLVGNLIYFIISCGLLLSAAQYNDEFFLYVKLAGGGYLAYLLLVRYVFSSNRKEDEVGMSAKHLRQNLFLCGLVMQLSNPKTILFFSAFLPQFIDTRYSLPLQFSIMAGLSWSIEYTILIAYATGAQLLVRRGNIKWGNQLEHFGNAAMGIAVGWSWFSIWS